MGVRYQTHRLIDELQREKMLETQVSSEQTKLKTIKHLKARCCQWLCQLKRSQCHVSPHRRRTASTKLSATAGIDIDERVTNSSGYPHILWPDKSPPEKSPQAVHRGVTSTRLYATAQRRVTLTSVTARGRICR